MAARAFRGQPGDHTLQPTALLHEAWLKLARAEGDWNDETHFRAVAATAMRQVLLNHAERRGTRKRGGGRRRVGFAALEAATATGPQPVDDLLDLAEAIAALERADARKAQIVELRLLGGLTMPQVAARIGRSLTVVEDDWRSARAWLAARLEGAA